MDFEELLRRRRMVRRYRDQPVPEDKLGRILDAAQKGPSAGFAQGQSFVVVTDSDLRSRIAELAGEPDYLARGFDPWLSAAPVHVVCCTSEAWYRRRYDEPDKRPAGAAARGWPVPYWYVDAGCSLMLLLLGAVNEGLAAGFLDLKTQGYAEVRSLLGIPADQIPIGLVTLGYPLTDRRSGSLDRGRRPPDEVIHRNRWGGDSS